MTYKIVFIDGTEKEVDCSSISTESGLFTAYNINNEILFTMNIFNNNVKYIQKV